MVTGNYDNVAGVEFSEWLEDDEQEPSTEMPNATLEEMYVSNGHLYLAVIAGERGMYFNIPILAREDWNDVVDSLPRWADGGA